MSNRSLLRTSVDTPCHLNSHMLIFHMLTSLRLTDISPSMCKGCFHLKHPFQKRGCTIKSGPYREQSPRLGVQEEVCVQPSQTEKELCQSRQRQSKGAGVEVAAGTRSVPTSVVRSGCATLSKLLPISSPQFPHLYVTNYNSTYRRGRCEGGAS